MARPTLFTHRKFLRLVDAVGGSVPLAVGILELLWSHAYESGEEYVGTAEDVQRIIRWGPPNGAERRTVSAADVLVSVGAPEGAGFLDADTTGPITTYRIHDLWHHAPEYVRKRKAREVARRQRLRPSATRRRSSATVRRSAPNGQTPAPAPAPAPAPTQKEKEHARDAEPDPLTETPQPDHDADPPLDPGAFQTFLAGYQGAAQDAGVPLRLVLSPKEAMTAHQLVAAYPPADLVRAAVAFWTGEKWRGKGRSLGFFAAVLPEVLADLAQTARRTGPDPTRPRWQCPHTEDPCGSEWQCQTRTALEAARAERAAASAGGAA